MTMTSLFGWFKRQRHGRLDEDDFQQELRSHLAIAEAEKVADGVTPEAAHYASLREFGNTTLITDEARRVWTPGWLEALRNFSSDVPYAIRTLAKNPSFVLTVTGVLTLGIGVNASVFTILKGLTLVPLAGVDGATGLVHVFESSATGRTIRLSYPEYAYLRDHARAFSSLFGSTPARVGLGRGERSRSIGAELVTGNYFQALGVNAELGRTLQPSDEITPGQHPVIMLSDGFWRRDFAADPSIIGKTITINHYPLTVVGVSAASFHGAMPPVDTEVFIPVLMGADLGFTFDSQQRSATGIYADRRAAMFQPQGFLRPGVSLAAAKAETAALWPALARERAPDDPAQRLQVAPFWRAPGSVQQLMLPMLTVLAITGLLVLMIACANVAGLALVRGVSRQGEIAVRLALGGSRARVIQLLMIESLVVALPGTVMGVVVAARGTEWLVASYTASSPQRLYANVDFDPLVIAFAAGIACLSSLVFGLVPAMTSSRIKLVEVINATSRRAGRASFRAGLVVAQVAVSVLLLIGASLATRSFEAASNANPGFEPVHLSEVRIDLKQNGYDTPRGRAFYQRLLETARADVGVESATLAAYYALAFSEPPASLVSIDGYQLQPGDDLAFLTNTVASDYFRTMRIPVLAGREFEERYDAGGLPVAIVNRTLAERFFNTTAAAIGRRVRIGDGEWRTIVGVAADVKYVTVNESPRPYVYVPFQQDYRAAMVLHTRGAAPERALVKQARANVVNLDPDLPILTASSTTDRLKSTVFFIYDMSAMMLFVFGTGAIALAALGIYGLVSYSVRQSTREIGVRMAIGASTGSVLRQFLRRGIQLGAIGVAAGVVAAIAVTRLLTTLLYGVSATDPIAFIRGIGVVVAVIVMATLLPAWRAARTNPLAALRHE